MSVSSVPILSITGSDSSGGAGIQADIRAISSLGGHAVTVVTTLTIQNSLGIQEFYDIPAEVVERQIAAVADDAAPHIFKIGLIRNVYMLDAVVRCIKRYHPQWVLYTPIAASSHGDELLNEELIDTIQLRLIPLCSAIVVHSQDVDRFECQNTIIAADRHGHCNELCSAIAVFLTQGCSLDEAERKARNITVSKEIDSELSGRNLALYRDFLAMQEEECLNSHDVNYYAEQLNISTRYLAQIVRKVANSSPKVIIDNTLLSKVKSALHSNKTIQEIAYELGFSSQAHLTKFFRKMTGVPPSEWRRPTQ